MFKLLSLGVISFTLSFCDTNMELLPPIGTETVPVSKTVFKLLKNKSLNFN